MADKLVLEAAVAITAVWENTARGSGKLFWRVVTDGNKTFTAFSRDFVARLIDGQTGKTAGTGVVYNYNPPLNTVVFFEASMRRNPKTGQDEENLILTAPPEGKEAPAVTVPPQTPAPAKPPYRPTYQKSAGGGKEWKPKDERPSLVTMNTAYGKDLIVAIIANNDALRAMRPDEAVAWAKTNVEMLARELLGYALEELKALGLNVEEK